MPRVERLAVEQHDCVAGRSVGRTGIDHRRLGPDDAAFIFLRLPGNGRGGEENDKPRHDLYKQVEKLLLELHPYDQPEILATAVAEVSVGYLKWLTEQVSGKGQAVGVKSQATEAKEQNTEGRSE